jgi:hypothetical protein
MFMKTKTIELQATRLHPSGSAIACFETIQIRAYTTTSKTVVVAELLSEKIKPILLEITHQECTTLLDFTGVVPYEIWYFDAEKQCKGKALSTHSGTGSFRVETQARFVLLWHCTTDVAVQKKLQNLPCVAFNWEEDSKVSVKKFPPGYGVFPYLIIKHEKSPCFTQIPIRVVAEEDPLLEDPGSTIPVAKTTLEDPEKVLAILLGHFQSVFQRINENELEVKKMALVLDAEQAYYLTDWHQTPEVSDSIPSGGILLTPEELMIAQHTSHFI